MVEELTGHGKFCRRCGYDLYALRENRCPECGKTFDAHDPKTYFQYAAALCRRYWAKRILVALIVLFLLVTASGVDLWYSWYREQAAVQMVQRYECHLQTATVGPPWLQRLLGKHRGFLRQRVDSVDLEFSPQVTDADLPSLRGLPHLRFLSLSGDSLSDAGLANPKNLTLNRLKWRS